MIDAQSKATLFDLGRRLGNSMLQYICDSNPWKTDDSQSEWDQVVILVNEERDMLGRIIQFLRKHHVAPPPCGAYPMSFTTINYMPIPHLVSLLIKDHQKWVSELEMRSTPPADDEAKSLVDECTDMAKRHLQTLEELRSQQFDPPLAG